MRFGLSTVILSLVAATSVIAAPVSDSINPPPTHLSELEQRGWVMDKLRPLFQKAINSLQCNACVAALTGAKSIAYLNKNWVLDAANGLCKELKLMDADVVRSFRPSSLSHPSLYLVPPFYRIGGKVLT